MKRRIIYTGVAVAVLLIGAAVCGIFAPSAPQMDGCAVIARIPAVAPDYAGITIPPNIAPLNFSIREDGVRYHVRISSASGRPIDIPSSSGRISIPARKWRRLLARNRGQELCVDVCRRTSDGTWQRFITITNRVANAHIDSHLVYRLIPPMHHKWHKIGIYQRCIENFDQKAIVDNRNFGRDGCVNCHTFRRNDPETMSFQIRSPRFGLPMIVSRDDEIRHVDTRTAKGMSPAAYHSWHPGGKIIAFSRNKPSPFEHSVGDVRDVWDDDSNLAVYFIDENRVETPEAICRTDRRETWPSWSADGKHLYYCSAEQLPFPRFREVHYDLMRIPYDLASNAWGEPEMLVSGKQAGMSAGESRESPDGRWLLFCMCEYGNFPVYQRSSDLFLMDLATRDYRRLNINSGSCDSWHCWSSNGKWIAFASKRGNELVGRVFFSHFDDSGNFDKPFVLPQRDPSFYDSFLWTYNVPELITGPIRKTRGAFARTICEPEHVFKALGDTNALPANTQSTGPDTSWKPAVGHR